MAKQNLWVVKWIVGMLLTGWPLPLCAWWMVHTIGWKVAAIILGTSSVAMLVFAYGFKLLVDVSTIRQRDGG